MLRRSKRLLCLLGAIVIAISAISTTSAAKGWLGLRVKDVTLEAAGALALPDGDGALVVGVTPSGPAARAGVVAGDVVVAADGVFLSSARDLLALLDELPSGAEVTLELIRWGRLLRLRAVTANPAALDDVMARLSDIERRYQAILPEFFGGQAVAVAPQLAPLADMGHKGAQNLLGLAHEMSALPNADMRVAAYWYRLAAEQGAREAQHNLAALYEAGVGVPRDPVRAYYWYQFSAEQGNAEAAQRRDALAARMPQAQRADAQRLIAAARQRPPAYSLPRPTRPAEPPARPAPTVDTVEPAKPVAPQPSTPAPVAEPQPSRAEVAEAQRLLAELGFDPGPADGIPGRRTRKAVRDFQTGRGDKPDGKITPALLKALRQAVAALPPPAAEPTKPTPAPEPTKVEPPPPPKAEPVPDDDLKLPPVPEGELDADLDDVEPPRPPRPPGAENSEDEDDLGDLGFPRDLRIDE